MYIQSGAERRFVRAASPRPHMMNDDDECGAERRLASCTSLSERDTSLSLFLEFLLQ